MAIAIGEGRRHERNYCFCKEKRKKTCKIETMASTKQDRIIHARNYNDCSGRHARNYGLRKGWRNKHMQVTMIPARGQANTESYAKKHFRQFFRDKKIYFRQLEKKLSPNEILQAPRPSSSSIPTRTFGSTTIYIYIYMYDGPLCTICTLLSWKAKNILFGKTFKRKTIS